MSCIRNTASHKHTHTHKTSSSEFATAHRLLFSAIPPERAQPAGAGSGQVRRGLLPVPGRERRGQHPGQRPADHPRARYGAQGPHSPYRGDEVTRLIVVKDQVVSFGDREGGGRGTAWYSVERVLVCVFCLRRASENRSMDVYCSMCM